MKKLLLSGFILTVALFFSCSTGTYEQRPDGVLVTLRSRGNGDPRLVRLQVVTPEIIRVSSTPEGSFPERESLVVLPQSTDSVPFSVSGSDQLVELATDRITARVSLKTGAVNFYDAHGKLLLEEQEKGGKQFSPISADQTTGYSFRQVFESPGDEAFYGLGQHQSDEWNYKGRNEVLYQYNTKVAVPFLVSSRDYGILWDNYSLTRFGNPGDYADLSHFTLYNSEGEEGGLTATYVDASGETLVRREETGIDYENLETIGRFPEEFPFWESSISWEGELETDRSGAYEFKLYYAGYTKVSIDGVEVVPERWRTAWNPNTYKFSVNLDAGKRIPVSVQWRPDGGVSYIGLKVMGPLDPLEQGKLSLWSEMGQELDYYFIHGENMDRIISGYRTLTGKAQIMPRWAYGFWQSRERYRTQEEIVGTLAEFRQRGIPIDNIVQDWFYWPEDQWGSHEFDAIRFPDPKRMVEDIHRMNAQLMISVWPKFYINTGHFAEFDRNGWIYRQAVEDSIRDWVGQGYVGSFYDAYSQAARILFWEQMNEHLYGLGIDAWWMDASEPDILSNASLGYRKKLSGPTALGSSTEFLNTYSLANADAIYQGQRKVDPDKRVFLLTRSGFAGLQRYSTATWSGDIGTRWEDMKAQISAGLNFALSGIPHWTFDIGGFCVERRYENAEEGSEDMEEWRELNTRWFQFGAFLPLFRSHGQYPPREIFNIAPADHPAYHSMLYYDRLRYHLMPYIYSQAARIYFEDYTLMRALVMDFPGDEMVRDIGDQFMFGPDLMVCPVYTYRARSREVWFPRGTGWYNLYTGDHVAGGQRMEVDAPYERMPVFARAGSIIPCGPAIQYTDEKPDGPITFYIYAGANGTCTLYEDEGVNYNYEEGACSRIIFTFNDQSRSLSISERRGEFRGMIMEREFNFVVVDGEHPGAFDGNTQNATTVLYKGTHLEVQL